MTILESIILGIVQGLTEFLPISSSGHLVLFQRFMGLHEGVLTFDLLLHLATLVAVITVFWKDIVSMIKNPRQKLTLLLIVATIPTGIIGLAFKDFFEMLFNSGKTLGIEFLATGLIIWFADRVPEQNKKVDGITYFDAVIVGLMQGIAILPAVSRSGLTIAGALFRGINRETAARFSFLVSLPAIAGAAILDLKDMAFDGAAVAQLGLPYLIGPLAAGISGYWAIKVMIKILQRGSMRGFAYYVWALGVLVIGLQLAGKL